MVNFRLDLKIKISRGIFWDFSQKSLFETLLIYLDIKFLNQNLFLSIPLYGESPDFDLCLRKSNPKRITAVALALPCDPVQSVEMLMWNISVDIGWYLLLIPPDIYWRRISVDIPLISTAYQWNVCWYPEHISRAAVGQPSRLSLHQFGHTADKHLSLPNFYFKFSIWE